MFALLSFLSYDVVYQHLLIGTYTATYIDIFFCHYQEHAGIWFPEYVGYYVRCFKHVFVDLQPASAYFCNGVDTVLLFCACLATDQGITLYFKFL